MNAHKLARVLKRARKAKGLSQTEVARVAGLSRPWLCVLENGKGVAGLNALRNLSVVLEIPLAELLDCSDFDHTEVLKCISTNELLAEIRRRIVEPSS